MLLGQALKQERKKLHLSQTKMAAGVISTAFYSKVERDEYDLDTMKLMKILSLHGINATTFIQKIKLKNKEETLEQNLHQELLNAYAKLDLTTIKSLKIKCKSNNLDKLFYLATLMEMALENNTENITENIKHDIKTMLFNYEEFDKDFLNVFTNTMTVFNITEIIMFIKSILKKYKNVFVLDQKTINLVSSVLVNFLAIAYINHSHDSIIDKAILYLKKIPEVPENCFAKIMANYYQNLFAGNKSAIKNTIIFLNQNNMSNLAKKIIKYDNF